MAVTHRRGRRTRRLGETLLLCLVGVAGLALGAWITQSYLYRPPEPAGERIIVVQHAEEKTFLFSTPGVDRKLLKGGWHGPESWGIWSKEPRAELAIPIENAYGDLQMNVHLSAYQPQNVRVEVNGTEVGTWRLTTNRSTQTVTVPRKLIKTGQGVEVAFVADRVVSPKEMGESRDGRKLGIGLIELTLSQ